MAGSGNVEPASEVIALATERGGIVTRVTVVAGDRVKAGQPLFAIDDRNYRATVAQDEAAVATANASLAAIDQNLILQRDAIDQARANLEGADAERTRAALDLEHVPPQLNRGILVRRRMGESIGTDSLLGAGRCRGLIPGTCVSE